MGSHSWCPNDFDPLIARCQSRGINLYSLDHAGHGYSEGPRNLIPDTKQTFEDAFHFVNLARESQTELPFFLMGSSLGGLTALKVGLKMQQSQVKQFQGAILFAPAIEETISPPNFFTNLIRHTLLPLLPRLTIPGICHLDPKSCYRDPGALKIISEDRLRYRDSPGLPIGNIALLDAMKEFRHSEMSSIEFPLFVVHGRQDVVTPISGSELLFEKSQSKEKTLRIGDQLPHCILADPEFGAIWDEIVPWMETLLGFTLNRNLHG